MLKFKEAGSSQEYELAAKLVREYATKLSVDLDFQDFNNELKHIERIYGRPAGVLFLAFENEAKTVGCFGIRKLEEGICELKRMYLREEARGRGCGKELLSFAIRQGKKMGYKKMRLDTLPDMQQAIRLYEKLGFYDISSYRYNPLPGARFLDVALT